MKDAFASQVLSPIRVRDAINPTVTWELRLNSTAVAAPPTLSVLVAALTSLLVIRKEACAHEFCRLFFAAPRKKTKLPVIQQRLMKNTKFIALFVALIAIASIEVCRADPGIIGDTVRVSRQIPSTGFTFGPFVYTAQAGPADTVALSTGNNLSLNVEDTSLQFFFGPGGGSGGPYTPFQHFLLFEDLSPTAPSISGLTFQTDLAGFTASDIIFTAHTVTVGEGGLDYSGGQHLTINLQFVPEPSSFALLGFAGAIIITLRTRRFCRRAGVPRYR